MEKSSPFDGFEWATPWGILAGAEVGAEDIPAMRTLGFDQEQWWHIYGHCIVNFWPLIFFLSFLPSSMVTGDLSSLVPIQSMLKEAMW